MKKIIIAGFALLLSASAAQAQSWPSLSWTLGAERGLEAEVNTLYSSVGLGALSIGTTMVDTATTSGQFNVSKLEVDIEQSIGVVTLYMKNDFNDDLKHTETVLGGKIKF